MRNILSLFILLSLFLGALDSFRSFTEGKLIIAGDSPLADRVGQFDGNLVPVKIKPKLGSYQRSRFSHEIYLIQQDILMSTDLYSSNWFSDSFVSSGAQIFREISQKHLLS